MAVATVSLVIEVSADLVPDLLSAIAPRMVDSDVPALAAIAAKIVSGTATTGAEKTALAQGWIKRNAKAALIDYHAQQAALAARANANDPAVMW